MEILVWLNPFLYHMLLPADKRVNITRFQTLKLAALEVKTNMFLCSKEVAEIEKIIHFLRQFCEVPDCDFDVDESLKL